jgi:hypothetical protein
VLVCSVESRRLRFGLGRPVIEVATLRGTKGSYEISATMDRHRYVPLGAIIVVPSAGSQEVPPGSTGIVSTAAHHAVGGFTILPWIHTRGERRRTSRTSLTQRKNDFNPARGELPKLRPPSLYRPAAVFAHRDRRHSRGHTVVRRS